MIYKHATELFIRGVELVEAEGRLLRKVLARFGLGMALGAAGAVLVLAAALLLAAGVWKGLADSSVGPAWASVITGVVVLGMAGGLIAIGARLVK